MAEDEDTNNEEKRSAKGDEDGWQTVGSRRQQQPREVWHLPQRISCASSLLLPHAASTSRRPMRLGQSKTQCGTSVTSTRILKKPKAANLCELDSRVTLFMSKVFKFNGRCSGRIMVDVNSSSTVHKKLFWLYAIYVRPWKLQTASRK